MNLTAKQQEIVDFKEGALLVTACPGSGKTRVLTERIKRLLLATRRGKILAVTFSNKAADEMNTRLSNGQDIADLLPRVTIGTLHSFAMELVLSRYHTIGLSGNLMVLEREEDRMALLKKVILDSPTLRNEFSASSESDKKLSYILAEISMLKRNFTLPSDIESDDGFSYVYREYNNRLLAENWLDYDDILLFGYRILMEVPAVAELYRGIYRYVCVDEAQDLNYAQYQFIKAFCGDSFKNVMFVGDARQSIYGFNGSSSDFMTKYFVKDFAPKCFELTENFRSARKIIDFANHFVDKKSDVVYPIQGELTVKAYHDESAEAQAVVEKINQLCQKGHSDVEGPITYNRIAVIARNRFVFKALEEKFTDGAIPFFHQQNKTGLESESKIMYVFYLCLRIMANPKDRVHVHELVQVANVKSYDDSIEPSLSMLLDNTEYAQLQSIINTIDVNRPEIGRVVDNIGAIDWHLQDDERYMLMNDFVNWKIHWQSYCQQVAREDRSLSSFLNLASIGRTRQNSSTQGITMLSAHMSKGSEFDIVFVIGLCEGTFPDYRAINKGGIAMEQEKNNMFVAITRAKRLCYLSYPEYKKMPWGDNKNQTPSRYIKDFL